MSNQTGSCFVWWKFNIGQMGGNTQIYGRRLSEGKKKSPEITHNLTFSNNFHFLSCLVKSENMGLRKFLGIKL